jgi:glutamate synthase domain-containing protein 3
VLGSTGVNFAAGMSGGIAYVYDEINDFDQHCNLSMVDLESVQAAADIAELRGLLQEHLELTGSPKAKYILQNWNICRPAFVKVFPVDYRKALGKMLKEDEAIERKIENN